MTTSLPLPPGQPAGRGEAANDDLLTAAELVAATGKANAKSQAVVLARLGLPFRFTGRAVLLERAVARAHELLPTRVASSGPRWDRLR